MNINSFSYVVEIERCGSINRAAQNLYVSQSNLSAGIKALENELGYRLFTRNSQGISPTPEGYMFLQSAKVILSEIDKLYRIPQLIDAHADISISCAWSSKILKSFFDFKKKETSDIKDSFKETGLIQTFEDIQENRYRLSIYYCFHSRSDFHKQEAKKTNLTAQLLGCNIPAVAVLSKDHPLANKPCVKLREIYQYPMVLFEGFGYGDWLSVIKTNPEQKLLYLFDRGAIMDAILDNLSVSVTMKGTIRTDNNIGIKEIPICDIEDSLDLFLLKHTAYELNDREAGFIKHLEKSFKK